MKQIRHIKTKNLSCESHAIYYKGKVYHAMNHLDAILEAFADDDKSFEKEYGINPDNYRSECENIITEKIIANQSNNILGIDIRRNSRVRYFVVHHKPAYYAVAGRLMTYCNRHGFKLAYYHEDKPGIIVPV